MFNTLLVLHVIGGTIALSSAIVAMFTKKGKKLHKQSGRYFFYSMSDVFLTAVPMAYIKQNVFLFLIALFSYYLAFTGWRYSKMKNNKAGNTDFMIASLMIIISVVMLGLGIWKFDVNSFKSISLLVFGLIGVSIARKDLVCYKREEIPVQLRISKHLGAMIGGTIAASTAFAINTIHIQPETIVWLAPTVIFTPLIFYWNTKV